MRKPLQDASADRLTYLDGLRGIAALAVALFAHYGHFAQTAHSGIDASQAPGYRLLAPLYGYSWTAVELFFAISGIVFAHVYANRLPSASEFARRRFARLYPLHFGTLAVVALLVLLFQHLRGYPPVYGNNDGFHFVLNMAFVQFGILSEEYSFNGPSYSLAIEAVMYALFYVTARYTNLNISAWLFCVVGVLFLALQHLWHHLPIINNSVAIGLVGFFGGVILFRGGRIAWVLPLALTASALISANLFCKIYAVIFCVLLLTSWSPHLRSVLSLPILRWLGERSLSVYLVHFPLQVGIMLVLGPDLPFRSFGFLAGYALLLLLIAHATHLLIERPAQAWLLGLNAQAAPLPLRGRPATPAQPAALHPRAAGGSYDG